MHTVTIDDLKAVFARILWGHDQCDDFVTLLMASGIPRPLFSAQFDVLDDGDRYRITLRNLGTRYQIDCKLYSRFYGPSYGPQIEYGGCPGEWQTSDGAAFAGMLRVAFLDLCTSSTG